MLNIYKQINTHNTHILFSIERHVASAIPTLYCIATMAMLGSSAVCPVDKQCSEWARKYIQYCLCSKKDGVSLALGLMSVLSWGVAEIPQIITNYKQKSTEGLSIAFLLTWIVGDLFNLFGCKLEPATLPTQYYMAMLFTATTMVLAIQTIYYGHIYHRLKSTRRKHEAEAVEKKREQNQNVDRKQVGNLNGLENRTNRFLSAVAPSSPISLPALSPRGSPGGELFYMSARSLSMSHTPRAGSFPAHRTPLSDTEQNTMKEPLLSEVLSTQSTPPSSARSLLCVVSFLTFFLGSVNYHNVRRSKLDILQKPTGRIVIVEGRKLLQVTGHSAQHSLTTGSSWIAPFLGWGMAAIYVGGRLPQICLNIRRGNVEGLNPLMFVFALFGNATYVASILVNSLDWSKIRPNLPWLIDAGGCVLLDTFILAQFIYFHYRAPRDVEIKHNSGGT